MSSIGDRLKLCRNRANIKVEQVSKETGINRGTLSKYENNINEPSLKALQCLCDFFNVSLDWMARGEEFLLTNEVALSQQEYRLIEMFAQLTPDGQKEVISFINFKLNSEHNFTGTSSPWRNGGNDTDENDSSGIA